LRSEGEALSDQLLRELPEALGVARVEGVGLDPIERIGRVVDRGDMAVLEINAAPPVELRCGRRKHRRRRTGFHVLELHAATARAEELVVLRLQVPAELGHDRAGMQRERVDAAWAET